MFVSGNIESNTFKLTTSLQNGIFVINGWNVLYVVYACVCVIVNELHFKVDLREIRNDD
jgi:hypothetical protein